MRTVPNPTRLRRAFTLFELLLVLAVLAVLAGVTWPMAQWWYRDHALRQSAPDVRVVLGRTRVHAIDEGVPYDFRYEPGGRRFVALPVELPPTDQAAGGPTATASRSVLDTPAESTVEYLIGELPEGVVFSLTSPGSRAPTQVNPDLYGPIEDAAVIGETTWSSPVRYRHDGTTDDDRLVLVAEEDRRAVTLEIRGITAEIRTSNVHREGP